MGIDCGTDKVFVRAGYVCYANEPVFLHAVVGSGVVVTLWDRARMVGGMCYFIMDAVEAGAKPTPYYADPSVNALISMFLKDSSRVNDLEGHIYGGAENKKSPAFIPFLSEKNAQAAEKALSEKGITIAGKDVGGNRGRKIIFNSATGELVVAKVLGIRNNDWYPDTKEQMEAGQRK